MLRRSRAFLIGMAAVLTMLLVPATFTTEAAPTPCADVFFVISYIDPVTDTLVDVFDDSNAKFGIPVGVELTFKITPNYLGNVALRGKEVKFSSPNQFLTFIPGSASDTAGANFTYKQNLPNDRPNVNWQLIWKKGDVSSAGAPFDNVNDADGVLSFKAVIDPANVVDPIGGGILAKGALLTIGTQIAGARCSAKIEIYGTPRGGGPGPQPCPGIVVDIYYEANDGKFYPAIKVEQSPTNTQFAGPSLGNNVLYVITPLGQSNQPVVFDKILHHVDRFFRQDALLAISNPAGAGKTIQNGIISSVFWNKNSNTWNGQTLIIKTVAKSVGLDTTTFVSKLSPNGAIVNLCSVHKEVRISANAVPPQGIEYPDPFAP
jgi:hypothetical protein